MKIEFYKKELVKDNNIVVHEIFNLINKYEDKLNIPVEEMEFMYSSLYYNESALAIDYLGFFITKNNIIINEDDYKLFMKWFNIDKGGIVQYKMEDFNYTPNN
jgi:hypothetical protein